LLRRHLLRHDLRGTALRLRSLKRGRERHQPALIMPGLQLVLTITAGNYDLPGQGEMPLRLWRDMVLQNLSVE
jgi:hypothetical protein